MDVLDQGSFQGTGVIGIDHDDGDVLHPDAARRPEPTLPGDQLPATPRDGPDHEGLQNPQRSNRGGQFVEGLVVKRLAWLAWVGIDVFDCDPRGRAAGVGTRFLGRK
jgi:hypothetical protein